jgi:hypothetical protein
MQILVLIYQPRRLIAIRDLILKVVKLENLTFKKSLKHELMKKTRDVIKVHKNNLRILYLKEET